LHLSLADRAIDKPAQMPTSKLPCRTVSSHLPRTLLYHPTGRTPLLMGSLSGQEKEHLSFGIGRNVSPSLLETLYGFGRNPQELCHFALAFSQMASNL
jgi:hypothetical protein